MESFIVSARKYRPQTFQSVVGQKALTTTLKNAIRNKHLAHAYLFCGPRGVGKTTCARIFAKTINCNNLTADFEACNECESCKSFNDQRSYNIHELDAASNNSVDDVRSLTEQVRIPPQMGNYSVYIIDEVHMLSQAAFNAFLKTLEEPPAHAIFILATTEKHKIIPTILSRCQIYDFNRISVTDTIEHLKYVAGEEGVEVEENALNVIAQKSDGGMRDALSIFDQLVSFCGNKITYHSAIENLNVLDYDYYFSLVETFLQGNLTKALLIFNEVLQKGFEGQHFISGLSAHLRDVLVSKDADTIQLLEVGADIGEKYKKQAAISPVNFLFSALTIANECDLNYRISKNKRLLVELALIKMCQIITPIVISEAEQTKIKPVEVKPTSEEKKNETVTEKPDESKIEKEKEEEKVTEPEKPNDVSQEKIKPEAQPVQKPIIPATKVAQRPSSISISNLEKDAPEIITVSEPELKNNPFTQSELEEKWKLFIDTKISDNTTKDFLTTHTPQVNENFTRLQFSVHNKFQEKEISQLSILEFLRKELKNNVIELDFEIIPENEQTTYLTPQEVYKKMADVNPAVEKLRRNLEMEID